MSTSAVAAGGAFKAFSLSSGDAAFEHSLHDDSENNAISSNSSPYNHNAYTNYTSQKDNSYATNTAATDGYKPSQREWSFLDVGNNNTTMNNTMSAPRPKPHSEYIHESIDEICNKAKRLIYNDNSSSYYNNNNPPSNYELGSKEKAIMSRYMPQTPSDESAGGMSCDLDALLRKYTGPSSAFCNTSQYITPSAYEGQPYPTKENKPVSKEKSKSSLSPCESVTSSVASHNNRGSKHYKHETNRSNQKISARRVSKTSTQTSLTNNKKMVNQITQQLQQQQQQQNQQQQHQRHQQHQQQQNTISDNHHKRYNKDESPNNNSVIRFTRCGPQSGSSAHAIHVPGYPSSAKSDLEYNRTPSSKNKPQTSDATNNSCMCHKAKPCPVHDPTDQMSMTAGTNQSNADSGPCRGSGQGAQPGSGSTDYHSQRECGEHEEDAAPKSKKRKSKQNKANNRHFLINEAKRVFKENEMLKAEGMYLNNELECTRKGLIMECAKVLHTVLSFCDEKTQKKQHKKSCDDPRPIARCTCTRDQ